MKVEVGKFADGRSLKVRVRFENTSNFWTKDYTWVPEIDEVELVREALLAIDEYNKVKKGISQKKEQ